MKTPPFASKEAARYLSKREPSHNVGQYPPGAPLRDYLRSPIASRIGELALKDGLFCFNYEHRHRLEVPELWLPHGHEVPEDNLDWSNGNLSEPKYQSFRHDLLIGSFHPGHRGKWTTHELCHALVGYAWIPEATPFFHATAARLAELLPVAVYYFFDEVRLQRCELHDKGGPLFRNSCSRCEALAAHRPFDATHDEEQITAGIHFLEAELAAIHKTRMLGVPWPHRYATLELCSDGLAYARAHTGRLQSRSFHDFVRLFGDHPAGMSHSLDELRDRVIHVARALIEGTPYTPHGAERDVWVRQDWVMRLLQIREDTEGEAAEALLQLAEKLAQGAELKATYFGYQELAEGYFLPDTNVVFATGYRTAASEGSSLEQIESGLAVNAPLALKLASTTGLELPRIFAATDQPARQPLGERLARWLADEHPGPMADLAAFENAIRTAQSDGVASALESPTVNSQGLRFALGARLLMLDHDVVALAEAVEDLNSSPDTAVEAGPEARANWSAQWRRPTALVVSRSVQGELMLIEIPWKDAQALKDQRVAELSPEACSALIQAAALVPQSWAETSSDTHRS